MSSVSEGAARLYVYRAGGWRMFRSLNDIYVDGRYLGTLESGRYVFSDVDPGGHVVTVKVRRAKHISVDAQAEFTVATEVGLVYYLRVNPSGTWNHPPAISPVEAHAGSMALKDCVLASDSFYY